MTDETTPEEKEVQLASTINLSITDLANIKQIIDVASQRGAFKASEYQQVGAVYDRLTAFLNKVVPPAEVPPNTETPDNEKKEA